MVLSGIVIGISTSLSNAQYAKNQNLANSYAHEGMTALRKLRDESWPQFLLYTNSTYCIPQGSLELEEATFPPPNRCSGYPVGEIFYREVMLEHISPDPTPTPSAECGYGSKATVKVSWSDGRCSIGNALCHKVELISCFSRAVPVVARRF